MSIWLVTFHKVTRGTECFYLIALLSSVVLKDKERETCICNGFCGPRQVASFTLCTSYWPGARPCLTGTEMVHVIQLCPRKKWVLFMLKYSKTNTIL